MSTVVIVRSRHTVAMPCPLCSWGTVTVAYEPLPGHPPDRTYPGHAPSLDALRLVATECCTIDPRDHYEAVEAAVMEDSWTT